PITVFETLGIANEIQHSKVGPARIDLGKLAYEWHEEQASYGSQREFINDKLRNLMDHRHVITPKDVVLDGFVRIGRLAGREIINLAGKGEQLRLRAIVTRGNSDEEIVKRA